METGLKKYYAGLVAGLACAFICFSFSIYPSTSELYVHVPLAILAGLLAMLFSFLYRNERWYVWICLIVPYVLVVAWKVGDTLSYNAKYEGYMGHTQVYWTTIYLFASPVISSLLGPLLGPTRLISFALALIVTVGLAVKCQLYITDNSHVAVSARRSVLLTNDSTRLSLELRCKYERSIHYLRFSYYEENGCAGNFNVINKDPEDALVTNAVWMVDGDEKAMVMSPIGAVPLAYSPHKYDNVTNWSGALPVKDLATAQEVQFKWGDIQIQLQPDQLEALKQTALEFQTAVTNANK